MSLNSESIIGLVALLVTSPPTVYLLYKLATGSRTRGETSDLPLHRNEDHDEPQHRMQPPTLYLQRHETWSCYTNIIVKPTDARQRSMTAGDETTASREI
ncbi:uncharacterized protein CC84DRAFT_1259777 [Paraphaeosphaeria sporulosa]|uniref:Uncharacterized protein n=1 Tax=Paraphaeosphaeria sporulosa TaxID=1460663 RepID=A0A177CBX4_9PLEO|nr:uncharacterized protein CC84DRAFT_1259777 [Paraphaeosphaeria sporulosa]OAG04372.1 hypothetical protein CC84DRAFT_1259777 [Paraphaeosphaeria sporulosa]